MVRFDPKDPDCWYGVDDPKKRKQIQDRLAQRARRKRLAQQRARAASSSTDSDGFSTPSASSSSDLNVMDLVKGPERSPLTSAVYAVFDPPPGSKSERMTFEVPLTIYSALYNNGVILGLTCATVMPQKSKLAPNAPAPLQPTKLQLEAVHLPWIDRFPIARMRDNMIRKEAEINEEEFLADMFNMASFNIKPGRPGWDPEAWVIDRKFARKWGFLLQ